MQHEIQSNWVQLDAWPQNHNNQISQLLVGGFNPSEKY